MVEIYHTEQKIPVTVLETKISNQTFRFTVESKASVIDCVSALDEFKVYVNDIIQRSEDELFEKNIEDKHEEPLEV